MYSAEQTGMSTGMIIVWIALYVYVAWCLMVIAQKTGHGDNAWMAWIPIINIILMLQVADKPIWWIILMFIPLVNIVIGIIVWMAIAEARGKPSWWGILIIVPFINFFVPAVLASGD